MEIRDKFDDDMTTCDILKELGEISIYNKHHKMHDISNDLDGLVLHEQVEIPIGYNPHVPKNMMIRVDNVPADASMDFPVIHHWIDQLAKLDELLLKKGDEEYSSYYDWWIKQFKILLTHRFFKPWLDHQYYTESGNGFTVKQYLYLAINNNPKNPLVPWIQNTLRIRLSNDPKTYPIIPYKSSYMVFGQEFILKSYEEIEEDRNKLERIIIIKSKIPF